MSFFAFSKSWLKVIDDAPAVILKLNQRRKEHRNVANNYNYQDYYLYYDLPAIGICAIGFSCIFIIGVIGWIIRVSRNRGSSKSDSEANVEKVWVISDVVQTNINNRMSDLAYPVPIFNSPISNNLYNNNAITRSATSISNRTYLPYFEHEIDSGSIFTKG
ncbi:hypothetical protein CONCODRAFT_11633 [Conidiobolus coronatus NRRL 28638]|uniref:Uncharacterized protein n=1 Tax=Conidiobolus coronatus (strain ATCC 28846 / CBS 209.66 / NRRL 28638) TaxID=796925 RepID=A0A137NUM1_CONC2|nr:hypothetical protein CONCODRAFT_11633 [Conidiobolus coronatus NRRL 28638]|eukprot:KXN66503.1 hypothetical protein CONCODRAFT_11633 [Conidiobolus coronatus NRRL 28638]